MTPRFRFGAFEFDPILAPEREPRMLAELIRVSDGVHVWVRSFDRPQNGRRLGLRIGQEAAAALGVGGAPGMR